MSIKLLIADGQEVVRAGLRCFLAGTEIEVVAEAPTGVKAVQLTSVCKPDVVLMAVRIPNEDGLSALKLIKQRRPETHVILTADEDHAGHLAQAHALGAAEYLVKDFSPEGLLAAIRAAAAGKRLWTRTHMRRVSGVRTTQQLEFDLEVPLTPREMDVLCGLAEGKTNQVIGVQLGISAETVKEHVQHLLRKIGVEDRTQAAVWAVRRRLA
jgi:DNA-binding NarL/FixJ family response regulator